MEQVKTKAELQQAVNDAVTEAGNLPVKTQKQLDKEAKQEKLYWNSMITREEARTMVLSALGEIEDKVRMMFVSTSTIMNALLQKGLVTAEELDEISKPIVQALYGMTPQAEAEPTKEDGTGALEAEVQTGKTSVGD